MEISDLTAEQREAYDAITEWVRSGDRILRLGGLAGTGKTTILGLFNERHASLKPGYVAPTGKAATVLRRKLVGHGQAKVTTIHGLLYNPGEYHCDKCPVKQSTDKHQYPCHLHKMRDKECGCALAFSRKDADNNSNGPQIIVCDESSMVSKDLYDDMLGLDLRYLFVGDHRQLPPVRSKDGFNVMNSPDIKLETIHRQVADSGILKMATLARTGQSIPYGRFAKDARKLHELEYRWKQFDSLDRLADVLILCQVNRTRIRMNKLIRNNLGFPRDTPVPGDRMICLRNNWKLGIYNGMMGKLVSIFDAPDRTDAWVAEISLDDENRSFKGFISKEQVNNKENLNGLPAWLTQWDYGYCTTVHKAQGSESKKVILFEERISLNTEDLWQRWLYTGITRASERLLILR